MTCHYFFQLNYFKYQLVLDLA